MSNRCSAIHHIALGARDVERLAAFYAEHFGLREVARHHQENGVLRSIWLEFGGGLLMVERTDQERSAVQGVGAGPFLLAFVTTPNERATREARLEAAGCRIESRTRFSSYSRDPEGNRIALSHYPLEQRSD